MYSDQINGVRAYSKVIDNKVRVFLSYEDVLNRLGLITYNQIPNQKVVTDINGKDQYGHDAVVDWTKINIYVVIGNLIDKDPDIVQYIPNPLLINSYIPSELAIELARQCGNQQFEIEITQQIVPGLQPQQQNQIKSNISPKFDRNTMFVGSISQMSNAERLYYMYKDTIRYVRDIKKIAVYQPTHYDQYTMGGKWFIADYEYLNPMIKELAQLLMSQAHTKEERRIANSLDGSYNNSVGIAKSLSSINESIVNLSDFDRYPYLLNVLNGVIDLRTGELLPADPNLYLSKQAPVMYNPYARSPIFEQFITSVLPDPDTREAVLRYLGYCLTGDTSAQKALFIIGSGANGKSTLLNVISSLLGLDYSFSCPMNFFSEHSIRSKSGPTPERAELIGRRFIQIDEIKAGEVLDANEFKLLTGSNAIPFRAMYGKASVIINPTHKFIFSGNFLPSLGEADGGVIRRLMVAEFDQKFTSDRINPYLLRMLTTPESLSGILNLLVVQASIYYREGLGRESDAMINMREEYVFDVTKRVQSVLNTKYIQDPDSYILVSDLEDQVNQAMYPNRLKYGQLKRIMNRLGYESVKLKSNKDRDKWAYIGFKKIQND